ncbi:class I mannose-6-phosphate isomerase [Clostridiaceae bacterium M8S5]|nr:class I mannose-6-phosphate isomerase [Clostridiaceae bacterium M8S5]
MYPLKFKPIYFEKIWGSRRLTALRDDLPQGDIGESWDVACHKHGMSVVQNGKYEDLTIEELIKLKGDELLGQKVPLNKFPLLVKLISTDQKLSVQVHPDDKYAYEVEGESGKTEAWYIVEASENSSIIVGFDNCTKDMLKEAIQKGEFETLANEIKVKAGEVYFIKSGLVHAIGEGLIIAEIQQNSDITYRVHDYNRGRELHIDKALDVINMDITGEKSKGLRVEMCGYSKTYYCLNEHFALDVYEVDSSCKLCSDIKRFNVITCVEGEGKIKYGQETMNICKGDSILIPASLGKYEVLGKVRFINSYIPDVKSVRKEIMSIIE